MENEKKDPRNNPGDIHVKRIMDLENQVRNLSNRQLIAETQIQSYQAVLHFVGRYLTTGKE
jgi:hypothetical protein